MPQPELTLFYDSTCPICAWEKRNLARKDKRGCIGFIDIHATDFKPEVYGITMPELMERLHAMTADGRMIKGVDTLIESYRAVGWWWAYKPIAMIPRPWAERAYGWFADHRHALSKHIGWMFGAVCQAEVCRKKR